MSDTQALNDVLATFQGTVLEAAQDVEQEITALDGKYVSEITSANNKVWDDGSMSLSFNLKVAQTVQGTKGEGRYIQKRFAVGDTKYGDAKENFEKLLKGLKTMSIIEGVTPETTLEGIIKTCEMSVGKLVNVKLKPDMSKGQVKRDDNGWPKHKVYLVEKFDIADPLSSGASEPADTVASSSPF